MPYGDGTGPAGQGAQGGICGRVAGRGCRRGRAHGCFAGSLGETSRELLNKHKEHLEQRLAYVNKQLEEEK